MQARKSIGPRTDPCGTLDVSGTSSKSESEEFTGDTPNDIISPGGSDGGEISPLNARVKRTWTHSHQTFQQRR